MACDTTSQGLQSTVTGAVAAQKTKFGAITQQLGAAAQGARDAAAALQRQTEELQAHLAAATASTTAALDATAAAVVDSFQVDSAELLVLQSPTGGPAILQHCKLTNESPSAQPSKR